MRPSHKVYEYFQRNLDNLQFAAKVLTGKFHQCPEYERFLTEIFILRVLCAAGASIDLMKIKRFGIFLIFWSVLVGPFIFVDHVAARSLTEILRSKEIRLCLAGSSQAFYKKNAEAFVVYLNEIYPKANIEARFIHFEKWNDQFVDADGVVRKDDGYTPAPLASGQCDLFPNDLIKTGWRVSKLAFVDLFVSRNTIVVHKSAQSQFKEIQDLAGKTIAVMKGTAYHSFIDRLNQTKLKSNPARVTFLPQMEALNAVNGGKFDFGIVGTDGAFWAIKSGATDLAVAFPIGDKRTIHGWCLRHEDVDLNKQVSHFFSRQREDRDSALNKNWKKYIGIYLYDFQLYVNSTP